MLWGGVNCFILITGWFGISHPLKAFLKIFSETIVYGFISYSFVFAITSDFSPKWLFDSIDFRNNWFVNSYFMLLLLQPIIERSLNGIKYEELKKWVLLLSIFNIVFVFLLRNFNNNGYNVIQFIWLYYIARFLRVGHDRQWYNLLKKYSISIYLFMVFCLSFGLYCLNFTHKEIKSIVWFGYNQPLVMLLSIALFITFAKIGIQSSTVNKLSTGVFGVYVLHTTIHLIPIRNDFANGIYAEWGYWGLIVLTVIIFVICSAISIPCSRVIKKSITTLTETDNIFK